MTQPLMPKATAVWLIENTALTFEQIAEFCGLHILEIQSLADEDYGIKIKGSSPIVSSQLTHEEIKRCEADKKAKLKLSALPSQLIKKTKKIGKKIADASERGVTYTIVVGTDELQSGKFVLKNLAQMSEETDTIENLLTLLIKNTI